jgi:mannose-6-phosphate isomerase
MSIGRDQPIQLFPIFRERVWGRKSLAPYFPHTNLSEPVGEAWYTSQENLTSLGISLGEILRSEPAVLGAAADPNHPGVCPLLVKMLFTTERLSVQVHPDDAYAEKHHKSLGKTEAWYVVEAEPDAEVAVGFRERLSPERLRESAQSGEIEGLLDWRHVKQGDVVFTPAGTVHAIGAGLTICEIQENSDITYRLYDYGRPRELHLEHGTNVAHLGPHQHSPEVIKLDSWREQLLESSYFRMERLRPSKSFAIDAGAPFYLLLICLEGTGSIGGESFERGQCWMIPAGSKAVDVSGGGSEWLLTYTAGRSINLLRPE